MRSMLTAWLVAQWPCSGEHSQGKEQWHRGDGGTGAGSRHTGAGQSTQAQRCDEPEGRSRGGAMTSARSHPSEGAAVEPL